MNKQEIFDKIAIDKKLLTVTVENSEILGDLQSLTTYIIPVKKVEGGDTALAYVIDGDGKKSEISFTVGSECYPEYEKVVIGLKVGKGVFVNGETVIVGKANRVVIPPVSNASVKSLKIDKVKTVSDFKEHYIETHGVEIKKRLIGKLYRGIVAQLINVIGINLSDGEIGNEFAAKKKEYLDACGGDKEEYELKLIHDFKKSDLKENEKALRDKCAYYLQQVAAGRVLAADGGDNDGKYYISYLKSEIESYYYPKINLQTEAD